MNQISLPYHLLIPSLISIVVLIMLILNRKKPLANRKWKWFWIGATVFFGIYLLIVAGATYLDISYKLALQRFDLNNDGFFTNDEITTRQKEVMRKVISDTGRNFAPITGLILSGFMSLIVLIVGKTTHYISSKKIKITSSDV